MSGTLLPALFLTLGLAACEDDIVDDGDETFTATLGPEGSVVTDASGSAAFELDDGVVAYAIDVAEITAVTAAHIHGPAGATASADVIVPLFAAPGGQTGDVDGRLVTSTFTAAEIIDASVSMDSLLVLMRNGQAYVNVHTVANPGGEIRGQITRD